MKDASGVGPGRDREYGHRDVRHVEYGLVAEDKMDIAPAEKQTRVLSNAPEVLKRTIGGVWGGMGPPTDEPLGEAPGRRSSGKGS